MPDRPNFPIPSELTPDTFCLQIQCPNNDDWKHVLYGLLMQPAYWFNWQRDSEHSGKELAAYWNEIVLAIDWTTMSCCCDNPPAQYRFDPETGTYQRSTDGGVTWTDAPQYDPRQTSTVFPPPSSFGFDNTKCQNADSMVVYIMDEMVNSIAEDDAVSAILTIVATAILALATAGTFLFFSGLLDAVVAGIFTFGVAAWKAAFTTDVLNDFRCAIYNNMDSDDSIDDAGITALLSYINSHFTGIVVPTLYGYVNGMGRVGATNAIRSNRGDPDANCDSCAPPECHTSDWNVYVGTEVSRTDTTLTVTTALQDGLQTINISTADPTKCCHISVSVVGWGSYAVVNCGDPIDNDHIISNGDLTNNCITWFNMANSPGNVSTNVTFTFSDCP